MYLCLSFNVFLWMLSAIFLEAFQMLFKWSRISAFLIFLSNWFKLLSSYQIFARLFWVYATKLSSSCYFYFTCSFVLRESSIVQVKRGWEDVLNDDGNKDRNLEGCSPHCWKELLPIRICSCLLFHHQHHLHHHYHLHLHHHHHHHHHHQHLRHYRNH